ncbi:Lsr2 family DNA-binding protein [Rhodococcus erythropolis]|uniref:Lsr2 family DNA-binding protein n=1 Tax=Rhodococcus erythropolis TaxID=1833 RepID=UPI0027E03A87|nr:hypothetical protein [Rhodococcus erythropolis]
MQSAQKLGNAKKKAATQAPAKSGIASRFSGAVSGYSGLANSNGYEVSGRGRIKKEIIEAFEAIH